MNDEIPLNSPTAEERRALGRLLEMTVMDANQSRHVALFLLAWWDGRRWGHIEIPSLWRMDAAIAEDALTVLRLAVRTGAYPDRLGYGFEFRRLAEDWSWLPAISA